MTTAKEPLWTIDELGAQVALALSADYEGPPNGRVREVPDLRTIRYYTTLGLLDRPAEMRGRTAFYGIRHLLQIVAIKRLQARGLALAAVQQQLVGLTNGALRRLAQLPESTSFHSTGSESITASMAPPEPRAETFWSTSPATVVEANERIVEPESVAASTLTDAELPWQGVPLDDQVMLLLEPFRLLEHEDISAIRAAAAPLLKLLKTRRLLRPRQERGTS